MAKKTLLTCTLLLGLSPLITSCVTSQDHRNLQLKVRNQNNRIVDMERQLNEFMAGGGDATKALQRQQADMATNMDRLKTKFLQIQGQLEETTYRNRALLEENQTFQQQLEAKMVALGEKERATQELLQTTSSQISNITLTLEQEAQRKKNAAMRKAERAKQKALEAEQAKLKAKADVLASQESSGVVVLAPRMKKGQKTTPQQVSQPTPAPPVSITPVKETPATEKTAAEKLYHKGLAEYRAESYKTAIENFTLFIEQNSSHKLLPNAKYWLGASRLKDGDYSGAVLEFQHIVADFPKHPKAPEALLRQAEAFGHFGDKMVQKKLYKDIINYYPKSEQAKTAKAKLEKL